MTVMADKGIGALVVLQGVPPDGELGGELAGIVSERDCARQVIVEGRDPDGTSVRDIMTRQVF